MLQLEWLRYQQHPPEGNKIEDNGDYGDDHEGEPGKEGDAEIENILDRLEDMSQKSKLLLDLKGNILHRLHLLLQAFLLSLLRFALSDPLLLLALTLLLPALLTHPLLLALLQPPLLPPGAYLLPCGKLLRRGA